MQDDIFGIGSLNGVSQPPTSLGGDPFGVGNTLTPGVGLLPAQKQNIISGLSKLGGAGSSFNPKEVNAGTLPIDVSGRSYQAASQFLSPQTLQMIAQRQEAMTNQSMQSQQAYQQPIMNYFNMYHPSYGAGG